MHFSVHAVEQFITRFAPGMDFDGAQAVMRDQFDRATRMKCRSNRGDECYVHDDVVFVVKRNGPIPEVVTVLYRAQMTREDPIMEEMREHGAVMNCPMPSPRRRRRRW